MHTIVEIPPDLMRAAKARAAESGESLKSLLTRAVATELDVPAGGRGRNARVTIPLFGTAGPRVRVSNADLERALAGTDQAGVVNAKHAKRPRRRLPG